MWAIWLARIFRQIGTHKNPFKFQFPGKSGLFFLSNPSTQKYSSISWKNMARFFRQTVTYKIFCQIASLRQLLVFRILGRSGSEAQMRLGRAESTLGQKPTFYPEITQNLMFEKCEFCEKWDFENLNFVKDDVLKMWIFWNMIFWRCPPTSGRAISGWPFQVGNFGLGHFRFGTISGFGHFRLAVAYLGWAISGWNISG